MGSIYGGFLNLTGSTTNTGTSTATQSDITNLSNQISDLESQLSAQQASTANVVLGGAVTESSQERSDLVGDQVQTNLTSPQIAEGATQTYTPLTAGQDEFVSPTDERFQVATSPDATASTAAPTTAVNVSDIATSTMTAATVGEGAAGSESAAVKSTMDPGTAAVAALGALPQEAMVQSQMEELTKGLETGEIPLWAQPAVDAIEAQLAARGLSRSSVGQAALSNAIISAALPMAQQNAQAISANFAQDKQNQQQVNMFNAQTNAQLQIQSLSNQQQMALQNSNLRQQAMLSDQAATNAARQFNATSENQTRQFMTNLKASVDTQNANRLDAMSQFNAQQENAMEQFNSNLQFTRDQFNAQNSTAIEQSNLQWRRQINQLNTAGVNSVNQANAMNAFNMSNQALTFMWQEMRDAAKWSFEAAQNDLQRKAALAQAALGNEAGTTATKMNLIAELGAAAMNLFS